jgi:hypothetical protein
MHKLVFYVPESHVEQVKAAVFNAGGGRMGDYDCCAWQTLGQGQFRPLPGSDPYIGAINRLERVDEFRVEIICDDPCVTAVLAALREAHPYEEPAYDIWRLADF